MALRVPTYENQVAQQGGAPLTVPTIAAPPEAAFGTNVNSAIEKFGSTVAGLGDKLADHAVEMHRQEQQSQVIAADTNFRKDLQNVMFNPEPDPDKNDVPKGVFDRQLSQAKGATQDFDSQYNDLRQKYLSQFSSPYQQNTMAKLMDDNYTHHRDLVIHHEANQMRENQKNIVDGNLAQMVQDAGNLTDPKAFIQQAQLGHDRTYASMKENGFDDGTIGAATNKFTSDMAMSAITPLIRPDPSVAMDYLDKISSVLTPTVKADIAKKIDVQARQLDELAKHEQEKVYDANMRSAMLDMFDGKLTLSEAERRFRDDTLKKSDYDILESKLVKPDYQVLREMQSSDNTAFTQIRQAQLSGTKTPGEISRMIAQGNADGKINGDDAKYLDTMTKAIPPDPRDQQVASQAQAVEDFGNRYFADHVSDHLPSAVAGALPSALDKQINQKQTAAQVDALKASFFKRVDGEKASGERVNQIANETMGEFIKQRYPEVSRLPDIPHIVVGIDGKVQRLLNPTQKTKLKGQYKVTRTGAQDAHDQANKTPTKDGDE